VTPDANIPLGSKPTDAVDAAPTESADTARQGVDWQTARRRDLSSVRPTRPAQFYPVCVNKKTGMIEAVGEAIPHKQDRHTAPKRKGCVAVFPVRDDGTEMNWAVTAPTFIERWRKGYVRAGRATPGKPQPYIIQYLKSGPIKDIEEGRAVVEGHYPDGSVIAFYEEPGAKAPPTQWNLRSHNAEHYGTKVVRALLPKRDFPFPKSMYAVEDVLRLFVRHKPEALVVDFFSGSGTTAHAVMRLNRQDGGRRRAVLVTNNEVAEKEQTALAGQRLNPGDPDWEKWGICEYITKPRIEAAIQGFTPDGDAIEGRYAFHDPFPMSDGFEENARFYNLAYLDPEAVEAKHAFNQIAHLLWLMGGAEGSVIDKEPRSGWALPDGATYGVLFRNKGRGGFAEALKARAQAGKPPRHVFIVADSTDEFHRSVEDVGADPAHTTRLYRHYLKNFRTNVIDLKDEL
jgi:adenine-specific DNA-methyltransferase